LEDRGLPEIVKTENSRVVERTKTQRGHAECTGITEEKMQGAENQPPWWFGWCLGGFSPQKRNDRKFGKEDPRKGVEEVNCRSAEGLSSEVESGGRDHPAGRWRWEDLGDTGPRWRGGQRAI